MRTYHATFRKDLAAHLFAIALRRSYSFSQQGTAHRSLSGMVSEMVSLSVSRCFTVISLTSYLLLTGKRHTQREKTSPHQRLNNILLSKSPMQ